jgi:hypothetical protein
MKPALGSGLSGWLRAACLRVAARSHGNVRAGSRLTPQKFRRTRNGIFTTASRATGFPALSAGKNFQSARAFTA